MFAQRVHPPSPHYRAHHHVQPDGDLPAGMLRLAGIAAVLVHGRHDSSGPPDTARAWLGSRLLVLDDAGHGGTGCSEAPTTALHTLRAAT